MNVKELIELLQKVDPSLPVYCRHYETFGDDGCYEYRQPFDVHFSEKHPRQSGHEALDEDALVIDV
jgi:hypothetical protein